MKFKSLITLILTSFSFFVNAQAPANDDCSGAIELNLGNTCNQVLINNQNTTDSGVPSPGCGNYQGGDLWFHFTADSNDDIIIQTSPAPNSAVNDTGMAVYTGSCSNLNLVDCDSDSGPGYFSKIILQNPVIGTDYFVRVWEFRNDSFGDFKICAYKDVTPPNDDCAHAIPLNVYPEGGSYGHEVFTSTERATDSGQHPSCDTYGVNIDVWFSFVAPTSGKVKLLTPDVSGSESEAAIYDGCGGNEIQCHSSGTEKIFNGLTPGQTYYLQIWHDDFRVGSFQLTLETINTTNPSISLSTTPDCSHHQFTVNVSVTDMGGSVSLTITDDQGSPAVTVTDVGTVVFGPYPSGTNVSITATSDDNPTYNTTRSTVYYCPATNDECAHAVSLNVYAAGQGSGHETSANTLEATDSQAHPSCDDMGTNLDLWFTFTAPNSGEVKLFTNGAAGDDVEAAIYDSCGGNEIDCQGQSNEKTFTGLTPGQTYVLQIWHDQPNAGAFNLWLEDTAIMPPVFSLTAIPDCSHQQFSVNVHVTDFNGASSVTVSDNMGSATQQLTAPGSVTFGPYNSGTDVSFTVVNNDHPSISATNHIQYTCSPANDECSSAVSLNVYPAGQGSGHEISLDISTATDSNQHPSCDDIGVNPDIWFHFTAPNSGKIKIISSGNTANNVEAAIYDSCGGNEIICFSNGSGNEKIVTGLTPGQNYILQVWEDEGVAGMFNLVLEEINNTPPQFSLTAVPDCNHQQFYVDVHVTNLGGATSVTVSDDQGSASHQITVTGTVNFGPYPSGTTVTFTVTNDNDVSLSTSHTISYDCSLANDNCAHAITLPVLQSCSPVIGTNTGATDSGLPAPTCSLYNGGDVWYVLTVPPNGHVSVETSSIQGSSLTDTGLAAYTGNCNNLTEIACDDDSGNGLFSLLDLNRTPGEIIYLRVFEYGNNNFGEFGICAYSDTQDVEQFDKNKFHFYPNPANEQIVWKSSEKVSEIKLYNMTGQMVLKVSHPETNRLDISKLSLGFYQMTVKIDNKTGIYKLIIK